MAYLTQDRDLAAVTHERAAASFGFVVAIVIAVVSSMVSSAPPDRASSAAPDALHLGADPARLAAPLSFIHDARPNNSDSGNPDSGNEQAGTLRYRQRFLSWQVLAPLHWQDDRITRGSLVVVEDNDDESTSAIVYEFAADGTVFARSPMGGAIGTIDLSTVAVRAELRHAKARRMWSSPQ